MGRPILYTFRRCPYAMRARLAIASSRITVELREIVLRDKAPEFLSASPKATVPVVVDGARVIEQSLDVMIWALQQNDPERLLDQPEQGYELIAQNDGPFKAALDRTKYAVRYPESDAETERANAQRFLDELGTQLGGKAYLFGDRPVLADLAILPFVRQFAAIDRARFDAEASPNLRDWLDRFLHAPRFAAIMSKYPKWTSGDPVTLFPPDQTV